MLKRSPILRAAQDWSKTLQLPRSTFPPRANPAHRAQYLRQCADDLYAWQTSGNRPSQNTFTLHDGPPYANGDLHIGHALNKILKDLFCRFQLSQGRLVKFIPGWDCHGLPIEVKALQNNDDHRRMRPNDIRQAARSLAAKTVKSQEDAFRLWGVMADWDNRYLTMDTAFEVRQLEVFKSMVLEGLIYRQNKPVYWSPSSSTALAEAELEYDDSHKSLSAFIQFPIRVMSAALQTLLGENASVYLLIWTTTPWTLSANRIISVHRDMEYCAFKIPGTDSWNIVAASRLQHVLEHRNLPVEDVELASKTLSGADIEGTKYTNPLRGQEAEDQPVIHAGFVSDASGSGVVHSAPGHGFDDYNICAELGIAAAAPVDDLGQLTEEAYPADPKALKGIPVLEGGSQAVIDLMQRNHSDMIWATHEYIHKYPIDWRTKQPLIIRATAQWFADVGSIIDRTLAALEGVKFIPATGRSRLEAFIRGRKQWCISRQRAWGVPIPALYRQVEGGTEETVMTEDTITHIIKVISQRGTDAWWTDDPNDSAWLHPDLPPGSYRRGKDTMDVWFDSGTTWTQLPGAFDDGPCADVYSEGSDQHRGWFQSSLLTRVATTPADRTAQAPYKTLVTHGFLLDGQGRKMSKSIGNVVSPEQVMDGTLLPPLKLKKKLQPADGSPVYDGMGPDALRLWAASSDYTKDIHLGIPVLAAINGTLHKYRVTLKFLLGVLADYDDATAAQASKLPLNLSEEIALWQLKQTELAVHSAYAAFEPFRAMTALQRYVASDLSAFYFETAKDPLYAGTRDERRAAQRTCYDIFHSLLVMLAPTTPLLVAEVLDHASDKLKARLTANDHNPFHRVWQPTSPSSLSQEDSLTAHKATVVGIIHDAIKKAQESARSNKWLANGLACRVALALPEHSFFDAPTRSFLCRVAGSGELAAAFVVESVQILNEKDADFAKIDEMQASNNGNGHKEGDAWHVRQAFELPLSSSSNTADNRTSSGTVLVLPPAKTKCPRCWRYAVERGRSEVDDDAICGRCTEAVNDNTGAS